MSFNLRTDLQPAAWEMTDYSKLKDRFFESLSSLYTPSERVFLWKVFTEHVSDGQASGQALRDLVLDDIQTSKLENCRAELITGKPYQYVLGSLPFHRLDLLICEGVLIPRPETEELVELIISDDSTGDVRSILDLGAGSGCIGLSLLKHYSHATLTALDISEVALDLIRKNALRNRLEVSAKCFDILRDSISQLPKVDLMVSNPPYITRREASSMSKQVTDHEPALALFVENEDPLVFYRRIMEIAGLRLKEGGKLFLELNAAYAEPCELMFLAAGWQCQLIRDMSGNDRFMRVWA